MKLTCKLEKHDVKSENSVGENLDLDTTVKIEVKLEEYNQDFYTQEKLLTFEVEPWDPLGENLYSYNSIDYHTVEDSSLDGSYRSLQEFGQEECKICHEVFMNRYHLIKHNSMHLKIPLHVPRTYQCDYCSVYFTKKSKLADHIFSMHNKNNNKSHNKKIYHCSICQKRYNYENWHEHMTSIHGNEKFQCTMCNVTFKSLRYLRTHNYYHHGRGIKPGAFKCKLCPKTFQYNDYLNKHVKNCHSSPVQCKICHSRLKSIVYLRTHMKRVHYDDGKIHKCDICFKEFKSPRHVRIHMKNTHAKTSSVTSRHSSPGQCEICHSRLKSIVYLRTHMRRVHYNDGKIHKCDICSKEFKSPRNVRIHMRNTHAKISSVTSRTKVYMSCKCGDSFASARNLESHLKVCPVNLKV